MDSESHCAEFMPNQQSRFCHSIPVKLMQVYLTAEFILLKHTLWFVMGNENGTQQPESHCVPFFLMSADGSNHQADSIQLSEVLSAATPEITDHPRLRRRFHAPGEPSPTAHLLS